jgi:hypothetical protein
MGNGRGQAMLEEPRLPPVRVVIAQGPNDVTIKVADQGGGIPFAQVCEEGGMVRREGFRSPRYVRREG